jgi:MFS family permease
MQSQAQRRLWTRDLVLLLGSTLLMWSSFYFLLPVLPLYVVQRLGGTPAKVGLLMAAVGVLSIVGRLVSGWAADRWGRRPVQLLFLALLCAIVFGYNVAATFGLLLLVRFLHGFPFGGSGTAGQVVASDLVPAERRGEGIGYYTLAQTLAMAVGPVLAFAILGRGDFGGLFVSAGLLGLGALVLAWCIRQPLVRDPTVKFSLAALFERRVLWMSIVGLFIALGYSGVTSFISLYAVELGVANPGVFYSLYAAGVLLIRWLMGRVFDRRGPGLVMGAGLVLLGLCYVTLALWRTEVGYLAGGLLFGLGYGASVPTVQAMAVSVVPPARRGAANATLFAIYEIGMSIGPYMNGLLAETGGGYHTMYLVGAALLVVPAVLFYGKVGREYRVEGGE